MARRTIFETRPKVGIIIALEVHTDKHLSLFWPGTVADIVKVQRFRRSSVMYNEGGKTRGQHHVE